MNKLVLVLWHDAVTANGWTTLDTDLGPEICWSAGWIVRDDAECLVLAATVGDLENEEEDGVNSLIAIPRGMVKKVWTVKVNGTPWA
jgi:hypothetical protein